MSSYRVISSDDHVFEPPDLWTTRAEPKFRDRVPRVVRLEDGGDWWVCEGEKVVSTAAGAQAGRRFEAPQQLTRADLLENVRPGGYIPEEHVKDMDADGIDVSIVYPTAALNAFFVSDSELMSSICRTYNDWVAEFCEPYADRLKGIAVINIDGVQDGIGEMERCAKMGFIGAMITVYPPEERSYRSREYDPLWAAAQDMEMPLGLHIGTNRPHAGREFALSDQINIDHWVRASLTNIIMTGVFERYPKLQVGSVEHELSWAPHLIDRLDYNYSQRAPRDYWCRFKDDRLPSDYFHSNVFLGFQADPLGIQLRDIIGVDNLQWGSDYPHAESTFPRSRQILEEILADCTEEEKAKIAGGNAARIYHLD